MQRLGSKRDGTRLMENRKQFHLVGTWSAECWGEEDVGGGGSWRPPHEGFCKPVLVVPGRFEISTVFIYLPHPRSKLSLL